MKKKNYLDDVEKEVKEIEKAERIMIQSSREEEKHEYTWKGFSHSSHPYFRDDGETKYFGI